MTTSRDVSLPSALPSKSFDPSKATHPLLMPLARLMPELTFYTIVSAVALCVDLTIFGALTTGGMRAAAAGIVGYSVGIVVHYVLSVRYVFDTAAAVKTGPRRFVEFVVSGLIGIGITWLIIAIATEALHWPALIAKIAAVAVSFIVVFLLRKSIVFAGRRAT